MKKVIVGILLSLSLIGCANMSPGEKTTLAGAGIGALAGSLIGGNSRGGLIGAGLGALGGAAVSNYQQTGNIFGNY